MSDKFGKNRRGGINRRDVSAFSQSGSIGESLLLFFMGIILLAFIVTSFQNSATFRSMVYSSLAGMAAVVVLTIAWDRHQAPHRAKAETCPSCKSTALGWLHERIDGGPDLRFKFNQFGCLRGDCQWVGSSYPLDRIAEHNLREAYEASQCPNPNSLLGQAEGKIAKRLGVPAFRSEHGKQAEWTIGQFGILCTFEGGRCTAVERKK